MKHQFFAKPAIASSESIDSNLVGSLVFVYYKFLFGDVLWDPLGTLYDPLWLASIT